MVLSTGRARCRRLIDAPPADGMAFQAARWLDADERAELERFRIKNPSASAEDHDGVPVFLARNAWDLRTTIEEWPNIRFSETREQS
jgi:peptide chain release factor 3